MSNERVMNDTTLPKSSSKTAASAPERRKKTGRFGLADWTRLLQSSKDLAQRKGRPLRKIRWEEIRQHNSVHDGWMVLKGKVYFLSPYLVRELSSNEKTRETKVRFASFRRCSGLLMSQSTMRSLTDYPLFSCLSRIVQAYHPGGEAILKPALGQDATKLFEKYHRWVNEDGCVVLVVVCIFILLIWL